MPKRPKRTPKNIKIEGYATKWHINTAQDGRPSYIFKHKNVFNKSIKKNRMEIPILLAHDMDKPVGRVIGAKSDEIGLIITAEIYDATTIKHIRGGGIRQYSICFSEIKSEYDLGSGIMIISEALLWEVTVCSIGAGQNCIFEILPD